MSEDLNMPDAMPTQKKGMPTWAKFVLGCGIAALVLISACTVGVVILAKRKMPELTEKVLSAPYQELRQAMESLKTQEGLVAFYQAHPGLARRYPTEQAFQDAFRDAPSQLGQLPETPGELFTLLKEKRLIINANRSKGSHHLEIRYRNPGKPYLVGVWENEKLVDLHIQ